MSWPRAEFGQDEAALALLGGKRRGFFVDIGASGGIERNNSYIMETQYAWAGVCVEPVPSFYDELRRNRSCYTVHACVGGTPQAERGLVAFRECINRELSRMDPEGSLLVPCLTFNTIATACGVRQVDFLSIDTEGSEYDILATIDFDRFDVRVITFEHNDHFGPLEKQRREVIHQLLTLRGFSYVRDCGVDAIYKGPNL